ncbi:MAG: DUF1553 domain-containing protein, partial [Planctomycetales bacterium]|nr:DUF1553 domain-containing protein [Planctomycetales bacterium]
SQPRAEGSAVDPANHLLWRMNPRRLDIEAYRDCLLQASGLLDTTMSGPSDDLERDSSTRRTVYGRIRRGRPASLLQLYDFPSPKMHSPKRETTTSPLQQLFIMNSSFIQEQAKSLVESVESELTRDDLELTAASREQALIQLMYRRVLGRGPSSTESRLAEQFLQAATAEEFAQALFATNEMIFWP